MSRPGRLLRVLAVSFALTSAIGSSSAAACEQMCTESIRLFPTGYAPGNLVRFKVLVDDPGPLALTKENGEVIPSSIRTMGADRVFAPEAPIAADTEVVLTYRPRCQQGKVATFRFRTMEATNLRLKAGTLITMARGTLFPDESSRTSAFTDLQHFNEDAMGYASNLVDSIATIDGMQADLKVIEGAEVVRVESYCGVGRESRLIQDSCGTVREVLQGKHVVEVKTTIVGESIQPPPARAEVELHCDRDEAAKAEKKAMPPQAARSTSRCAVSFAPRMSSDPAALCGGCLAAALLGARRRRA